MKVSELRHALGSVNENAEVCFDVAGSFVTCENVTLTTRDGHEWVVVVLEPETDSQTETESNSESETDTDPETQEQTKNGD